MRFATKIVCIALTTTVLCGVGIGTASAATPDDGHSGGSITDRATDARVSVVAYRGYLGGLQNVSLPAFSCPTQYPWLVNEDLSPGRAIPRGVAVHEPGSVSVTMSHPTRDSDGRASGWQSGSATNWNLSHQPLTVSAACTNDPAESYDA